MKNNKNRLKDRPRTNAKRSNMEIDDQTKSRPTDRKFERQFEKSGGNA